MRRNNWRTEANEFTRKLDKANKQIDELQQEKKRVEDARVDDATRYKNLIVKLENTNSNLAKTNEKQLADNLQLDKELRQAIVVVKSVNQNLEARVAEIDSVRKDPLVAAADRQQIYNTLIHTTDDAKTAQADKQRLEVLLRDLAEVAKKQKVALEYAKIRDADQFRTRPPA